MNRTFGLFLSFSLVAVLAGCNLPTGGTPELLSTPTPAAGQATSAAPTASASVTPPPLPSLTPSPSVPTLRVSVDTNCRSGPGTEYELLGMLEEDETTEVVGKDSLGQYWYVRNPDQADGFCWLWAEYASVSGDTAILPLMTPPPTPAPLPAFTILHAELGNCVGWYVSVEVKNTGPQVFESGKLSVTDLSTGTTVGSAILNDFEQLNGCTTIDTFPSMGKTKAGYLNSYDFAYIPNGVTLQVTATLCTQDGLGGQCVTQSTTFVP